MSRFEAFLDRGRTQAAEFVADDLVRGRRGGGGLVAGSISGVRLVRGIAMASLANIEAMAGAAFGRLREPELEAGSADPADRFAFAQRLHGRSDIYVSALQDNKHRVFLLYAAAFIALLAIDIATWRSYGVSPLLVLGHVAPLLPASVLAAVAAFHNWQLRTRALGSVQDFLRRPREWFPEPATPSTGASRSAALVLLAGAGLSAAIMGTAPGVHAQGVVATGSTTLQGLFQALPATDLWGRLLTFVFPGVGPVSGQVSPISNGIAQGFSVMTSMLMAAAAAMLAGQILVATVETAHSGQLLGRKWHTTWAPIRVCYGFAALVPAIKGYCLLQVLTVSIAVASGSLGNAIWTGFVGGLSGGTISAPNLPESIALVRDTLEVETCLAAYARQSTVTGATVPTAPAGAADMGKAATVSQWAQWLTSWWSSTANTVAPWSIRRQVWDYGPCGQISGDYASSSSADLGTMARAQMDAVDALRTALRPVAQAVVQSVSPGADQVDLSGYWSSVLAAKTAFDGAMTKAASDFVNSPTVSQSTTSSFQTAATQAGWVSAGAYYMTVARVNSATVEAARNVPNVTLGTEDMNASNGPLARVLLSPVTGAIPVLNAWWDKNMSTTGAAGLDNAAASAGSMRTGGVYSALKDMGSTDSALQTKLMNQVKLDPSNFNGLQQMVDMGDYIVGIGEGVVGTAFVGKLVATFSPAGRVATLVSKAKGGNDALLSGPLSFVSLFIGVVGSALMAAGVYDCLVLPMLPFLHWTFGTMGMLILVVEGVIAAPLWALAHVRMDGDEFLSHSQTAGYKILFNLLFRIPLMLFGLFFSFLVFNAMIWLLSVTLYPAMAAATADSLFGVIGTLTYVVLITGVNYAVANRAFGLLNAVPDRVTAWFGASSHGTDESHHANTAVGIIRQGSSQAVQGLRSGTMGAAAGGRGKKDGEGNRQAGAGEREQAQSAPSGRIGGQVSQVSEAEQSGSGGVVPDQGGGGTTRKPRLDGV